MSDGLWRRRGGGGQDDFDRVRRAFGLVMKAARLVVGCAIAFSTANADQVDFNREIRAILSDRCFLCHGPDEANREAGLRLDVREEAIAGGAILPGDADASELLARITSDDPDMVMPPPSTGKTVSPSEAETFRQWINDGAEYERHWSFVAPERPPLPVVSNPEWCQSPIDHFVMEMLDRQGLQPSPPADPATLVRRMSLDLIGLPPQPAEIDRWLDPELPDVTERLANHLLQSPHFGERWARWWLDAARYADSDGYEKDKPRSVWFYRDWVIDAMNQDKPYDEFIIEQIAGDLLPGATQDEHVATGFLRNSMINEEGGADPEQFRVEGMFDRVDAIGKAVLGITTQCAQCHTHKFDPISHHEYYQLFAALNDFHEAIITVYTPEQAEQREDVLEQIAAVEQALKQSHPNWQTDLVAWHNQLAEQKAEWTTVVPTDLPFEGQKFRQLDDGSILSESYAPTKNDIGFPCRVEPGTITAVRIDLLTHPQLPHGGPGRSIDGTGALTEFDVSLAPLSDPGTKTVLPLAAAVADVNPPRTLLPAAFRERDAEKDDRVTGGIEMAVDGDRKTAWSTDLGPGRRNVDRHAVFVLEKPLVVSEPSLIWFRLVQTHGGWNSDDNQNYLMGRYRFSVTSDPDPKASFLPSAVEPLVGRPYDELTEAERSALFTHWRTTVEAHAQENRAIEALWQRHPEGTSQLAVRQLDEPRPTHVMLRGDFLQPGDAVEPGAPAFMNPWPATDEPDRLKLARWLVDDSSPTTARVIVNRIWQAYFGRGIVSTPEDFGRQSPPPTHPQLLDWLAVELMENGWSLKHIHHLIVNSATYQQSSTIPPDLLERDRYNEWLARGPRFRVEAEMVRDIALQASGLLNESIGGPSVYPPAPAFLFQPPASYGPKVWDTDLDDQQYRRSLYVHRYRSVPYPPLQVFDAPKGDASCIRRERSNTPLQSLVMLNETQFVDCARAMALRILREVPQEDDDARLCYAHRLATGRRPDATELTILRDVLEQQRQRLAAGEIDVAVLTGGGEATPAPGEGGTDAATVPWIVIARILLNLDETITKG